MLLIWINSLNWRFCLLVGVLLAGLPALGWSQQYRSKILIDHADTLEEGSALSLEQLEQQLDDLTEPYARASTTRHLARQSWLHFRSACRWLRTVSGCLSEGIRELALRDRPTPPEHDSPTDWNRHRPLHEAVQRHRCPDGRE